MKTTVTRHDFHDAFRRMNRQDEFSYAGLNALFEYLEEYEESTGEELELDVLALCCDYTEYRSLEEVSEHYDDIETLEDLRDRTSVIELENGGLIVQIF